MKENKYYENQEISPLLLENITEKSRIHEYEKKSLELNLEKPSFHKLLNSIR